MAQIKKTERYDVTGLTAEEVRLIADLLHDFVEELYNAGESTQEEVVNNQAKARKFSGIRDLFWGAA